MSTESHPYAIYGVAKRDVPGVIFRATAMHDAIVANASTFGSPPITMPAFLTLITACSDAQQKATGTKATGTAAARNTKRDALWTAMDALRAYIQGLADVLSAPSAVSLIQSGGLKVASTGKAQKAPLAATLTTTPGTVHLAANTSVFVSKGDASKKVMFNWQWSGDGGKTWNDARSTPYASTDFTGLALLSTYSFRASVTVGKVTGEWSQPVSLLVH